MPEGRDIFESSVEKPAPTQSADRPWLGIRFTCANAYVRVYRNQAGTAYVARCPKCGESVRFAVGAGGTPQRFFEVSC